MPSVSRTDRSARRMAWREDFERASGIVATMKEWKSNIGYINAGTDKKPFGELAEQELTRIVEEIERRIDKRKNQQTEGEHQDNFYVKEAEFLGDIAEQLVLIANPIFTYFDVNALPYALELLGRANQRLDAIEHESQDQYFSYLSRRWAVSASILERMLVITIPSDNDTTTYSDRIRDCYNRAFGYAKRELERRSKEPRDSELSSPELDLWFENAMRYAKKTGKSQKELEQVNKELMRIKHGETKRGGAISAARLVR